MSSGDGADPDAALQRAIAEACLGRDAGAAIAADLEEYLASRGVAPEDVAALVAAPRRLGVYRSLVRASLGAVVTRMLPRTLDALDAALPGRVAADLASFVDEVGPRTHYLRDVPGEWLAWAKPRWAADAAVPPFLADLASYELVHFEVAASESVAAPPEPAELALDRSVVLASSVRIVSLGWAVHEEPPDVARAVRLVVHRDAGHAVRAREVSPLQADVLDRLLAGEVLGVAVQAACASRGVAPGDVIADLAATLAELAEEGAVLGAR